MSRLRPSPALFVAILALAVALSGTAYAVVKSDGDAIINKKSLSGNRLKADTVKGSQLKESSLKTVPRAERADTLAHPALVPLAFGSGWGTFSADYPPAGSRLDAAGFVHLQGGVGQGSGSSEVIGILPAGHRPAHYLYFPTATTGGGHGQVYINPDGEIHYYYGQPTFMSLDGIIFYAGE